MRIGTIAEKSGLSRDTIRLYEGMGMLVGVTRPNEYNNYKDYAPENLQRLEMIKAMKKFGFSLKEINEALVALASGKGHSEEFRQNFIGKKIKSLDDKIKELQDLRNSLWEFLNHDCAETPMASEISSGASK